MQSSLYMKGTRKKLKMWSLWTEFGNFVITLICHLYIGWNYMNHLLMGQMRKPFIDNDLRQVWLFVIVYQIEQLYWVFLSLPETANNIYLYALYICPCLTAIPRLALREKVTQRLLKLLFKGVDVVEWSRALDVRLSEWCCSESKVWVQIPSREEQKFDSSKI